MIYILAGSYAKAEKWAATQQLSRDEWFTTLDVDELRRAKNFHVIVLESAGELPPPFFEKLFRVARLQGRVGRQ